MCQVLDECAQTLATTHRGGGWSRSRRLQLVRRREQPGPQDGVCCTLQCSDAHCPAVVIWEG